MRHEKHEKKDETVNQQELESINSELFTSFDPADASWIVGGETTLCASISGQSGSTDWNIDFQKKF